MGLTPQSKRDQSLMLTCLLLLGAVAAYFQLVHVKKTEELDATQTRVEQLEAVNARAKRDMARGSVTKLKAEAERLRSELEVMRQLVPTGSEVPVLLDQVSGAARRVSLDVFDVQPDSVVIGEHFDVHRYRMQVEGDYHSIASFLANVGSLTRIVTPQNLQLSVSTRKLERRMAPNTARLLAKFDIQTYVAHGSGADALATTAVGVNASQGGRP